MRIIEIITIKKYSFYSYLIGKGLVKEGRNPLFNYNWKAYENIWKSALYVFRDRHILSSSNKVDHLEKSIILWGNMTRCFIDKVCIFIDIANFSLKFKSWSKLLYSMLKLKKSPPYESYH